MEMIKRKKILASTIEILALYVKMEMIHKEKKFLASTIEILALYVDLNERKVAEFEEEKVKIMNDFISKNKSEFKDKDLKFSSKLKK